MRRSRPFVYVTLINFKEILMKMDVKLVLMLKEEMHQLAKEENWGEAYALMQLPPLKEFLALKKWEQSSLIEDYKDEVRRQEMAGWTTKVLNAFTEDEADAQIVCFRPLGNGTVRVWRSQVYGRHMTDRDYNPVKDNYDGAYGNDGDASEVLPVVEARKKWAEMVKKVAYVCSGHGKVMMYTPAGAY